MNRNRWYTIGLYLTAVTLGWLLAFGGSKYVYRQIVIDDIGDLNAPEVAPNTSSKKPISSSKQNLSKQNYLSSISNRNIFDSSQINTPPPPDPPGGNKILNISDIDAQLLGTIVMEPKTQSLAMIKQGSGAQIQPYGIGDTLLDATIQHIEPEYVWIKRNNETEVLLLHGKKDKKSAKTSKAKKSSDDSGVSKSGKDKYTVDQAVFDELLQNPEKLYTQIRATEHKTDGEVDGYRVSGIRRKSIFFKLGIKNGDVIHSVNGLPLTNLNEAMKAFESLQSSRDFSFDVTRRRKKRTMEYEVR